ncbi:COMM domain-containing protein 4-like [Apostichopus japonicus]|uniref:COMM domain-containing protein 4-like n=1 Tax=Stichopus japonicus TaxID=307972 RepID=UPI003AB69420
MRFRFCGDLDCPDWVLAEMSILSKITSVKMKLLCAQVIKNLLGENIDYEKVHKLTSDAKYEIGDVKASIAALTFILSSAVKHNVDGESLSNELQQLGLPKEHSTALCKTYEGKRDDVRRKFKDQSFRVSRLDGVDWRVDYVVSSSNLHEVNVPSIQLQLQIANPDTETTDTSAFTVSANKFRVFLNDLKEIQKQMESLSTE